MICNICGQEMVTHKFEELNVCDECQVLIDKELAKPVVKQELELQIKKYGMVIINASTLNVKGIYLHI